MNRTSAFDLYGVLPSKQDLGETPGCAFMMYVHSEIFQKSTLYTSSQNAHINHALKFSGSGKCSPSSSPQPLTGSKDNSIKLFPAFLFNAYFRNMKIKLRDTK